MTVQRLPGGRRPMQIYGCPKCGLHSVPELKYCGWENNEAPCAGTAVDARRVEGARLKGQPHLHRRCGRCEYPSIIPADGAAGEP